MQFFDCVQTFAVLVNVLVAFRLGPNPLACHTESMAKFPALLRNVLLVTRPAGGAYCTLVSPRPTMLNDASWLRHSARPVRTKDCVGRYRCGAQFRNVSISRGRGVGRAHWETMPNFGARETSLHRAFGNTSAAASLIGAPVCRGTASQSPSLCVAQSASKRSATALLVRSSMCHLHSIH